VYIYRKRSITSNRGNIFSKYSLLLNIYDPILLLLYIERERQKY
jgi:hypothetical protein